MYDGDGGCIQHRMFLLNSREAKALIEPVSQETQEISPKAEGRSPIRQPGLRKGTQPRRVEETRETLPDDSILSFSKRLSGNRYPLSGMEESYGNRYRAFMSSVELGAYVLPSTAGRFWDAFIDDVVNRNRSGHPHRDGHERRKAKL